MEFLQSHASLSDLFSRTADFAANNKFYAVTVFVFLAVLLIGGFLPKSQYFVFVDSDTETVKYGKITKDSYDKWLKDPVKNTRLFVTVEDSTDPSVQSVSFPVGKANFSTV